MRWWVLRYNRIWRECISSQSGPRRCPLTLSCKPYHNYDDDNDHDYDGDGDGDDDDHNDDDADDDDDGDDDDDHDGDGDDDDHTLALTPVLLRMF